MYYCILIIAEPTRFIYKQIKMGKICVRKRNRLINRYFISNINVVGKLQFKYLEPNPLWVE